MKQIIFRMGLYENIWYAIGKINEVINEFAN